jgi:hypothetical protein
MKKWTKLLISTSVVAMMAMPLTAMASTHKSNEVKVVMDDVKKPELAATKGIITEIIYNKYGAFAMLEGKGVKSQDPDVVKLILGDDTKVIDLQGKKVDIRDVVKNEWTVTATYGPQMTMSIPPQSPAVTIVVDKSTTPGKPGSEINEYTGIIKSIKEVEFDDDDDKDDDRDYDYKHDGKHNGKNSNHNAKNNGKHDDDDDDDKYDGKHNGKHDDDDDDDRDDEYVRIYITGEKPATLMVNDDTIIVNEQGQKLNDDVLRKNVLIKATVDPKAPTSYPNMLKATKIVVLDAKAELDDDAVRAEGTIIGINDTQIHLDVNSDNNYENNIMLNISKDTKILNENGKSVKLSDLKRDTKIVSFHSNKMTKSIPAQAEAKLIIVTD